MPVITALFDTIYYSSLPADEREECEVRFDGDEIVVSKPSGSGLSMRNLQGQVFPCNILSILTPRFAWYNLAQKDLTLLRVSQPRKTKENICPS